MAEPMNARISYDFANNTDPELHGSVWCRRLFKFESHFQYNRKMDSDVSRKRKRKPTSVPNPVKEFNNHWVARDKIKLLEGIKKYGIDVDRLAADIGTKTKEEVESQLKSRAAEGMKSFRIMAKNKTAPIEVWQKRAMKNTFYYLDYSKILKSIIMNAAGGSRYSAIYKLLCDLMDGKPPADCNREDSLTLLKLIEDLASVMKRLNLALVTKMLSEDGIGLQNDDDQVDDRLPKDIILNPLNVPKPLMDRVWSQASTIIDIGDGKNKDT